MPFSSHFQIVRVIVYVLVVRALKEKTTFDKYDNVTAIVYCCLYFNYYRCCCWHKVNTFNHILINLNIYMGKNVIYNVYMI